MQVSEEKKTKTHQIAANINNIVIVLLRYNCVTNIAVADASWTYFRMEQMQKRFPEIMLQKPVTDGDEDEDGRGDSEANPDAAAEANYDEDGNEDAEAEP